MEKYEEILKKYKQEHIINSLNEDIKKQLNNINFEELKDLYNIAKNGTNVETGSIEPITAINPNKLPDEDKAKIITMGENIIKENKFAVVTMAGGQGTRLRS